MKTGDRRPARGYKRENSRNMGDALKADDGRRLLRRARSSARRRSALLSKSWARVCNVRKTSSKTTRPPFASSKPAIESAIFLSASVGLRLDQLRLRCYGVRPMFSPESGDVLLRGSHATGFVVRDAVTRELISWSVDLKTALVVARERGAPTVWQQLTDDRGRPLGQPRRFTTSPADH